MTAVREAKIEEVERTAGHTPMASPQNKLPMLPTEGTAVSPATSVTQLIQMAIERGTPVEQLEKLVDLHERIEQRQAVREFAAALAAFQAECPSIKKSSDAEIVTKAGGKFKYSYAELDEIARTVNPILARRGLSYGWDTKVDKDSLTCVCTLRHEAGHSVTSSFTLPIDNASAMSPQQKVGAAGTFAQRKSLSAVLGLTTTDDDTDAASVNPAKITDDQVTIINDLIKETDTNIGRFLKFMEVSKISEIRAADYQQAITALQQKRETAK